MQTECSADLFGFARVESRAVVAGFDGGTMTSDAGALLLGATDRAVGLVDRFATCFTDGRAAELIEHTVRTLVGPEGGIVTRFSSDAAVDDLARALRRLIDPAGS